MADDTGDPGGDVSGDSGSGGNLASTIGNLQSRTRDLTSSANTFARAMTTAFARGIVGAKSFDDVLKGLALRLSDLSLQMALKPVTTTLANGLSSLFNSLIAPSMSGTDLAKAMNTAKPFATGGVIASPSYFPLSSGGLGLAGEAGPEAIMPLTRGSDGRLGVAASGGGAPASVTVNIATPDAESFRRSESYLTGLVARAVARGQRGM
jgi:phage-related minor tail protein